MDSSNYTSWELMSLFFTGMLIGLFIVVVILRYDDELIDWLSKVSKFAKKGRKS